jgi:hypothetical protein
MRHGRIVDQPFARDLLGALARDLFNVELPASRLGFENTA